MGKKKSAKAAPESTSPQAPPAPATTKTFQSFERATVLRSQIRPHETNPRAIDQHALKKLKENLRKTGLVCSLIVNRRDQANGFPPAQHGQLVLIGGHQRCRAMDELRDYNPQTHENDYQIPVEITALDAGKEKEQLVFLNNPSAAGYFDHVMLGDLLTSPGVDPLGFGFSRLEIEQLVDSGIVEQIFGSPSPQAAAEAPVLDAIADIAAGAKAYTDQRNQQNQPTPAGVAPPSSPQLHDTTQSTANAPPALPEDDINSVPAIKGRRYDFRDKTADAGSTQHILTIVADSPEQLEDFLAAAGLPVGEPFISLESFLTTIGETTGVGFFADMIDDDEEESGQS